MSVVTAALCRLFTVCQPQASVSQKSTPGQLEKDSLVSNSTFTFIMTAEYYSVYIS